eukprot:EG_transcript_20791
MARTSFDLYQDLYQQNIQRRAATIGHGVEVRPSLIPGAGCGLFATVPFKRNDLITGVDGKLITHAEADLLKAKGEHTHIRTLLRQHLAVDGLKVHPAPEGRGGGTYANDGRGHEDFPNNAEFKIVPILDGTLPLCFLKAKEDIEEGDEILTSYGRQYWQIHETVLQRLAMSKQP